MSITIVQQRLNSYQCKTEIEEENALKEITQEIGLMALSRSGFFKRAEFHGGTALRVFYGLERFSEDLDFALLEPDPKFHLLKYLGNMKEEFLAFGYEIEIQNRSQASKTIQKAFLKDQSIGKVLNLEYQKPNHVRKKIRIKFEVDINPPQGTKTEIKFCDFPMPFSLVAKDLSSSFSGKLHALLCRYYIKGRDWYDFNWYVRQQCPINYELLSSALNQVGPWQHKEVQVNKEWILKTLKTKVSQINWDSAVKDVIRFLKPSEQPSLMLWNIDFFESQIKKMRGYL